jgi:hypothetical protein
MQSSVAPGAASNPSTAAKAQSESASKPTGRAHTTGSTRHQEERLGLTWRTVASSLVLMTQKADKAAAEEENNNKSNGSEIVAADANMNNQHRRDVDDSVVAFLRNRQEWLRIVSHLESKLERKALEMEVLQRYQASMPRLRKRQKREAGNEGIVSTEPVTDGSKGEPLR